MATKGDPTAICISYYGCMDSASDSFDPSATVSGFSPNLDSSQRLPGVTLPPECRYPGCLDSTYDSFDGTKVRVRVRVRVSARVRVRVRVSVRIRARP